MCCNSISPQKTNEKKEKERKKKERKEREKEMYLAFSLLTPE